MQVQTLEQLKEENAKAEQEAAKGSAPEAEESEAEAAEDNQDETGQVAEPGEDESDSESAEPWLQSEEDGQHFDNSDMAGLRRKMQGKLKKVTEEKDEEIETLKARLRNLETGAPAKPVTKMPRLEDFDYDEAKHAEAMERYITDQVTSQATSVRQTSEQQQAQLRAKEEQDKRIEAHYQRAAELAKDSGITPEVYQQSDLTVRRTVQSIAQFSSEGAADMAVDALISKMGDGSEKLMYYLGRNATARERFRTALANDPTGLEAGILLGEMKAQITQPQKRTSKAKPPAKRAEGGEGSKVSDWKRKYDKAKSPQDKYDIRYEARKAGEDVTNW